MLRINRQAPLKFVPMQLLSERVTIFCWIFVFFPIEETKLLTVSQVFQLITSILRFVEFIFCLVGWMDGKFAAKNAFL